MARCLLFNPFAKTSEDWNFSYTRNPLLYPLVTRVAVHLSSQCHRCGPPTYHLRLEGKWQTRSQLVRQGDSDQWANEVSLAWAQQQSWIGEPNASTSRRIKWEPSMVHSIGKENLVSQKEDADARLLAMALEPLGTANHPQQVYLQCYNHPPHSSRKTWRPSGVRWPRSFPY